MLRVLLLISLTIITSVCILYHQNPWFLKGFYVQKIINPRSWVKVEVVEEKPIGRLKDVFQSEVVWQVVEQLVGFVTGVTICVLIGWRVGSFRSIYEKSFENSLAECHQRQNRFEKQLGALELQIVDFERKYLYTQKETSIKCDSSTQSANIYEVAMEISKQSTSEQSGETYNRENQNDKNENFVRRAIDVIMKQEVDESNFECILEKLTKVLDRLSKLTKNQIEQELILPVVESDNHLVQEQAVEIEADNKECYKNESLDVENKTIDIEEAPENIEEGEEQNVYPEEEDETKHTFFDFTYVNSLCKSTEEMDEINQSSDINCTDNPYKLHACKSTEKIPGVMLSTLGAGECEETYKSKVVPVSLIPKLQEKSKCQKPRVKPRKECDDERTIPFVISRNTPERMSPERATLQTSPRKNSSSLDDRSMSRGGRKKQRN